jgi:hypothetical protein
MTRQVLGLVCLGVLLCWPAQAGAQQPDSRQTPEARELYQRACAACHGTDGRGMPQSTVGFDVELPDFTDCSFADARPGVKFADDELLGIPHRIVVGERALDRNQLEYRHRRATQSEDLPLDKVVEFLLERIGRPAA